MRLLGVNTFGELLGKMFPTDDDKDGGGDSDKKLREEHPSAGRENTPPWNGEIVDINARTQVSVVMVRPTRFDDVVEITGLIKERLTVILNLEQIDADCALRIVDFIAGAAYAGNGVMKRIAKNTCLIAPYDIEAPSLNGKDAQFEDVLEMFQKCSSGSQDTQSLQAENESACAQEIHSYVNSHREAESFTEYMLRIIRERGLRESDVYNRVFMDRKLFNKIRNNPAYQPSKRTALLLAVALELSLAETKEFLEKAGFVLSHANKTDLVVEFFITNKKYDIMELNEMLDDYGQPPLI